MIIRKEGLKLMKQNETLTYLARIMKKCNELDLPCERVITHYGQCIEELADDAIVILKRILSKPEIRTCRIPLIIDFMQMKDIDYWLKCTIFDLLPSSESSALKDKFELLTDLIMELEMMRKQVDPKHAEKFFKRMAARLKTKKYFPYEIYRADPDNLTIEKLWRMECQLTYDLRIKGVLDFDKAPSGDEVEKVRMDLLMKGLESGIQPPQDFERTAAKIRRYSYWKEELFMINYPLIYKELYQHCFNKLSKEQRMAIYEYDEQLKMVHKDMAALKPELAQYLTKNEDADTFGIVNSLTRLMQQAWFKEFRTDPKYDHAWIEKFVSDLLASEHQQELLTIWQVAKKRQNLKSYIIGCLNKAGVIKGSNLGIATALLNGSIKENTNFANYMGRGKKMVFCDWICNYVKD
jgi:hypothetical protein